MSFKNNEKLNQSLGENIWNTYYTKVLYPENMKNSYDPTRKKQMQSNKN